MNNYNIRLLQACEHANTTPERLSELLGFDVTVESNRIIEIAKELDISAAWLSKGLGFRNYADRLIYARTVLRKLTQAELEKLSKVGIPTISKIECGRQRYSSKDIALARALGVSPRWLSEGVGEIEDSNAAQHFEFPKIPLLKPEQIWDYVGLNFLPSGVKMVTCPTQCSAKAFRFDIPDNSMVNSIPSGESFQPGTMVICDPEVKPIGGDFVIAKIGDVIVFRELIDDINGRWLAPLNTSFSRVKMSDDDLVVGKIIFAGRDIS